jgi:hypothetical protein
MLLGYDCSGKNGGGYHVQARLHDTFGKLHILCVARLELSGNLQPALERIGDGDRSSFLRDPSLPVCPKHASKLSHALSGANKPAKAISEIEPRSFAVTWLT